jgi:hypothetical protein
LICLVVQGAKEVMLGEQVLRYDPASYFVASVELAASGRVIEVTAEQPYLCLSLLLDRDMVAGLLSDAPAQARGEPGLAGFGVSPVNGPLLDARLRLVRLLDAPADIAVLAPLLEREILYRVLQGPQADALRQAARADSRLAQVRRTIGWIRSNYDRPLRIEALAELAGYAVGHESASQFSRECARLCGAPPAKDAQRLRSDAAAMAEVASAA